MFSALDPFRFRFFQLISVADFSHVSQVETLLSAECENQSSTNHRNGTNGSSGAGGGGKAVVQIRVVGASEPLLITCTAIETAESVADLVDRYCRLVNGTNVSLWNKRGNIIERISLSRHHHCAINHISSRSF